MQEGDARSQSMGGVLLDSAGHITHVQVAVDGQWENARRAWRGDGANAMGALTSVLRTRGEFAATAVTRSAAVAVSGFVWGVATDRWGARAVLVTGALLAAAAQMARP